MSANVLIVVTNHHELKPGKPTGVWLSEFAEAYHAFRNRGFRITVASPRGGEAPVDPGSLDAKLPPDILEARKHLEQTVPLHEVSVTDYDAVFLPGGHGTMFDLPQSEKLHELLRLFYESGKIVSAVCHGPAGFVGATLSSGEPLVVGKRISAFTDREEEVTQLGPDLPFLLESKLRELGAIFVAAPNWSSHVEVDGRLITGQNPQSTALVAEAVIQHLS